VTRKPETAIELDGKPLGEDDATPIASSASATVSGELVAVGWGILDEASKLDDYKGKSVKGKIALVHRFVPPEAPAGVQLDAAATSRLGICATRRSSRAQGRDRAVVVDDGDPKPRRVAAAQARRRRQRVADPDRRGHPQGRGRARQGQASRQARHRAPADAPPTPATWSA